MVLLNVSQLGAGFSFGLKGRAQPGNVFPAEPTVTASDSTNAAKLAGLGYVAYPLSAWTTGQKITIGGFAFNWTGAAWAAGTHALMADSQSAPPNPDGSGTVAAAGTVGDDYPETGTIPDVKAWVGGDVGRAQEALDRENAASNPRVTLIDYLQDMLTTPGA